LFCVNPAIDEPLTHVNASDDRLTDTVNMIFHHGSAERVDDPGNKHAGRVECVLSQALEHPTIAEPGRKTEAAFEGLHLLLQKAFPRLHATLRREAVGSHYTLLYTWPNKEPGLSPWAILAHQDVAGVESGTGASWTHRPFAGDIADGCLWGRGALDMKSALVGVMQSLEDLIADGFAPRRTLMLCLGADEETGGREGAARIAALLRDCGELIAMTLDDGCLILTGAFPGVPRPVALIGVAQKGTLTLRLTSAGLGGHDALPERRSAVARLAECILRLERTGLPAPKEGPPRQMVLSLAGAATPLWRALYQGAAGVSTTALRPLLRGSAIAIRTRSTLPVTRFIAGIADNVVPQVAAAALDIRLRPGDGAAWATQRVQREAARFSISVEVVESIEPSRISGTDTPFFNCLAETSSQVAPGAVVVLYLTPNDTDSKPFADIADQCYRALAIFYRDLIQSADRPDDRTAAIRLEAYACT
jgi:carboxypeptidase PM20D1